jgi:predicted nucleic acid-binding protein
MISALLDANILVYSVDPREFKKRELAVRVLRDMTHFGSGAISTQTLAEFYNAAIRKFLPPLSKESAYKRLLELSTSLPVYDITLPIVLEAARGATEHQLSFWDAQVWATAKLNQIPYVFTEDLPGRDYLEGVSFVNPLADDFKVADFIATR